jgi:Cu/Ag efflux protein CusF
MSHELARSGGEQGVVMKASIVRIALALAVVLGIASGRSFSQEKMREQMKKEATESIEALRIVQLTVKDVKPTEHKVTFEMTVSPEASYRSGQGEPIRIDQLKPGDEVRAAFDPKTGEVVQVQVIPVPVKK